MAAVVFSDGTIRTALQDRLVEYGGCIDACCKFILAIEDIRAASPSVRPAVLMQVDQAGVLHAPHAQARSYYHEFGFDEVVVPVHTYEGSVALITIAELAPRKQCGAHA